MKYLKTYFESVETKSFDKNELVKRIKTILKYSVDSSFAADEFNNTAKEYNISNEIYNGSNIVYFGW